MGGVINCLAKIVHYTLEYLSTARGPAGLPQNVLNNLDTTTNLYTYQLLRTQSHIFKVYLNKSIYLQLNLHLIKPIENPV